MGCSFCKKIRKQKYQNTTQIINVTDREENNIDMIVMFTNVYNMLIHLNQYFFRFDKKSRVQGERKSVEKEVF